MSALGTNIGILAPEFIVALGAMALMMIGVFMGDRSQKLLSYLAIALFVGAGAAALMGPARGLAFNGGFIADGFARFAKMMIFGGAAFVLIMAQGYVDRQKMNRFEFPVLVTFSVLGMMLMASAGDFITLYLSLELQSLALYVLAAFDRDNLRSTEAGLKYFVLGALSSGMMLYGISLIYGFAATTIFAKVAMVIQTGGVSLGLLFGLVFLISGLAFKVSAVPFHMWTPDVYEGAPTPITAFFSASPKIAAMALFVRVMVEAFPDALGQWRQIIIFISILSMALGAVAAIGQNNIKRLMAYSSIANMGFILVGLAAGTAQGVEGVLIYLAIYLVTNIGIFACILGMRRGGHMVENISDLAGLAQSRPGYAFVFSMLMFSLAGIPPLAGFFAKFYVFLAAIRAGLYPLAVIGVVTSVVGAYYYLRIVKIIYFDEPAPELERDIGPSLNAIIAAAGVFTVFFVAGAAPLVSAAQAAAASLFP
ncbi:MAG TPA: NADH-quinone oxidoreductase subunit NuoN [Micropepsaceae bacterium]|jgi:NADH-quinone oxidoreductase subunit N|nr:NADH-quinone oxidoreductase subunit NuoN [Micropepsaceae bacterium]